MNEPVVSVPAAPPAPRLPVRYGRYVLVQRLGAGGMAEVFRAVLVGVEEFQSTLVVKWILPHLSANPAFTKMFIDEAKLCGRLLHPNIVRVHEFGKQDGRFFIAMEYIHGANLGAIMTRLLEQKRLMPPGIALEIIRQTCRGLAHAHGLTGPDGEPLGIIHRDVSPGNVMVDYAGAVKVLDFGVARMEGRFRRSATDPGHVKGKVAYLAPEQIGGRFDHRADLFSAGVLLHELLTGRRLFKAASAQDGLALLKSMPIPLPSQRNPALTAALDAIVMRALERDPARRYQSATEMGDALERYLLETRFSSQELASFVRAHVPDDGGGRLELSGEELARFATSERSGVAQVGQASPGGMITESPELEEEPAPARGRRGWLIGGGAVIAAAIAGAVLRGGRGSGVGASAPAAVPPPPVVAAPAPVTAPAVAPGAAPAPTVARAATVQLVIASEPAGATVHDLDDGRALGVTPLALTAERGSTPRALRISKPGHVDGHLKLVPDQDRSTLVTLARRASTRTLPRDEKVLNAVPTDPFAE